MTEASAMTNQGQFDDFTLGVHFSRTWEFFKRSVMRMFLVNLITFVLSMLLFVGFVVWIIVLTTTNTEVMNAIKLIFSGDVAGFAAMPGWYIKTMLIGYGLVSLISFVLFVPFSSAGLVLAVGKDKKDFTFGQLFKLSLKTVPVMTVLLLIVGFINLGTLWLMLIPSFFIGLLIAFAVYEMVLAGKGPIDALQTSVSLAKHDYLMVLGRTLFLSVVFGIVFYALPFMFGYISPTLARLYNALLMIPSIAAGWISIAYTYAMYDHLKREVPSPKRSNIWWIVALALVGWLIFGTVAKLTYSFAKNLDWQNLINEEVKKAQQEESLGNPDETNGEIPGQTLDITPTFAPKKPTAYPTKKPVTITKPADTSDCMVYKIREGEFASQKCYSQSDYEDLAYYLARYSAAISRYNGSLKSIEITCDGSDFFKSSCEQAKADKEDSQKKIDEYKAKIQEIIARGK